MLELVVSYLVMVEELELEMHKILNFITMEAIVLSMILLEVF